MRDGGSHGRSTERVRFDAEILAGANDNWGRERERTGRATLMVGQEIYAHITLVKGERSELADLASDLL